MKLTKGSELYDIDFSQFSTEERVFMESRREVMVERAKMIRRACKKGVVSHSTHPPPTHTLYTTRNTHPISSGARIIRSLQLPWMVNFMKLAHFNENNPLLVDLPEEQKERLRYLPKYGANHPVVYKLYPTPETNLEN
ncbi:hypothetical protein Pmani_034837 [Petrolisthes manimaculis]|uniref:Uncharacterized protein n=1 Tax=Petrolisthes manimaculis TaxID=1843537 RepID=A0AAE1NLZ2_9EUCA|nr:hypothetical protein Pmani_034837 [Petrolisthes manimaculis]